jgi:hypothetical protein
VHKVSCCLLIVVLILSGCATLSPVESTAAAIEADRPDFTESTETVPPRSIQAEGGYTYSRDESGTNHSIGELLIRVPATRHAEARIGLNSYSITRTAGSVQRGFEDMEIGTKVRLIDHEERSLIPNVSILALTTLPTGHRGIGTRAIQPTAKLALGWQLVERLSLQSNINYTYASEDGTRFSQWAASASFGTDLTTRLESFVEWFGTSPTSLGAGRSGYLDTGAAIKFGTSLRLDARIGVNTRTTKDYFAGVGLSRRW